MRYTSRLNSATLLGAVTLSECICTVNAFAFNQQGLSFVQQQQQHHTLSQLHPWSKDDRHRTLLATFKDTDQQPSTLSSNTNFTALNTTSTTASTNDDVDHDINTNTINDQIETVNGIPTTTVVDINDNNSMNTVGHASAAIDSNVTVNGGASTSEIQSYEVNNDDNSAVISTEKIMEYAKALSLDVNVSDTSNVAVDDSSPSSLSVFDAVQSTSSDDIINDAMMREIELEAEMTAQALIDENCEVDYAKGGPKDEICIDENKKAGMRTKLKSTISRMMQLVKGDSSSSTTEYESSTDGIVSPGEVLERGWEKRANASALVRNAEVWKFALSAAFRVLKVRKLKNATDEEKKQAQTAAAEYIRDGLLQLGPSFVKLGQVVSTRTDVLPATYTDVFKTLTDEVPGFSGKRAKEIVERELNRPIGEIFTDFSDVPLKAASLGQVHTAYYKGKKVAIKVQRAGLKELFDIDLDNLKKLAVLLDKFDPKSDGADRDWVGIYEESRRLLYLEINYLNEADNTERFARDFAEIDWVRIPKVYREVSTPRVLTMEFVESFKLTDKQRIRREGLDAKVLSKRVADAFLRQIIETAFFHADPHSGNLCVNSQGQLVYYDFGQMDELKPNVRKGFRTFCTALFKGGPMISDTQLAINAKQLVDGVEQAGVLSVNADRLAVEKLARYFMRAFKDKQLGKKSGNIKAVIGPDLQTLTDNNSFRFPTTFTFIFRAFASVDGIGKDLDPDFDIGKLAQPFVERFIDQQDRYVSDTRKRLNMFGKITGLNPIDLETAVTQPKKVAYIEETIRSMANGNLKVRVRSLENEKALERLSLKQTVMENVVLASLLLNFAGLTSRTVVRSLGVAGASFFAFQALMSSVKVKKFDKTQAKYKSQGDFVEPDTEVIEEKIVV